MTTQLIPLADWLATHPADLENACLDPNCKDYHDHGPQHVRDLGPAIPVPPALTVK